ncbi:unnamed protein product [Effrenium voratum]|nr:unnamed protein product [Effrenium voratum]
MALLQSHARRTTRRRSDGSPSCQAEGDNAEEGCEPSSSGCTAIVEVQQPGLVPSLKPLPLESNTVQMSSRLGLSGFVPGAAVHIVAALMGLVPFSVGYSMAKLWSAAGWKVADSVVFKAGCYSFIYANGIFPTVVCDYGNGRVGPLPSSEAAQQAMLRTTPLMVSNHMSYLDALILPLALQMPKFMSMSSVKNAPLFGTLGEDLEYIWVNRGSKDSRGAAMQAIDQHVKSWKPGDRPLMIFPEGTTTNGTAILEFKQGAFFSGAPVRPVLLKYTGSWHPAVTETF